MVDSPISPKCPEFDIKLLSVHYPICTSRLLYSCNLARSPMSIGSLKGTKKKPTKLGVHHS